MLFLVERLRVKELHRVVRDDHDLPYPYAPSVTEASAKAEAEIGDAQYAGLKRTPVEPIRIEGNRRMRLHPRQEQQERNNSNETHDQLIGNMQRSVRHIAYRAERQELIQAELRETADDRAKRRTHDHRNLHVALNRTLLRRHSFVRREEDKIQHLEADREESTDAGKFQEQGDRTHVRFLRRLDRHHLADEPVEERNARDGKRADDETEENKRISLRHTAELVNLANPGGIGNRITAHK